MSVDAVQYRVLVVEDEMSYRLLLGKVLRDSGFYVEVCADGAQALARLGKGQFDAVVLDHVMPGLSGLEVVRWIRSHQPQLSTILLTGYPTEEMRQQFTSLGVNHYLPKTTFDVTKIGALIKSLLVK